MKARIINWMMLIIAMFIISACTNENDFSDITDSKNLLTESIEVFEVDDFLSFYKKETPNWNTFYCFDDKETLYASGFKIKDTKLLNWRNRTLVIVHITHGAEMFDFSIKVYSKDGKYKIECIENYEGDFRNLAVDERCYGILLDKPNISSDDIDLLIDFFGD
jgi:hypothetical protein